MMGPHLFELRKFGSSLLDPAPPPGLELPIYWDSSEHEYDPQQIWLGLVSAGSFMAQYSGDALVPRHQTVKFVSSGDKMLVHSFHDESVTYNLIIWTFFELGTQLAQRYPWPRNVPDFSSRIVIARGIVGTLQILRAEDPLSKDADTNMTTAARHRRDAVISSSLTADSGVRPCDDDPNLLVRFQFLRRPLDPGQVFTAFLKSNTIFSASEMQERGVRMVAFSTNRRTHLAIIGDGQGAGANQLTWELARGAMRTIWKELIMRYDADEGSFIFRPRWEAVSFTLEYRGVRVGQGQLG